MHDGDMGNWGWAMMVVMPLLWLGIPALIAWAIWAASRSPPAGDQPPLRIARTCSGP